MLREISYFLRTWNYIQLDTNLQEFTVFFQLENSFVNVIHVVDITKNPYVKPDEYEHIVEKTEWQFRDRGLSEVHSLCFIISEDLERAEAFAKGNAFSWIICENRLHIMEDHVEDFYGIRTKLEQFLENPQIPEEYEEGSVKYDWTGKQSYKSIKDRPLSNHFFFLANVFLFTLCTFTGELLYTKGVMSVESVIYGKQWYRLLSSMFLHADIDHLVGNMLILYFLGDIAERSLGHMKYFILYLLAGLLGNLLSLWYCYNIGDFTGSLGASGAIFGMVGALLWLLIRNKGRLETMSIPKILFLVGYSAYSGLRSTNIDNMAHLGGFIAGFILCILLYRKKPVKKER
ncbi:MAG: rhomboid family intramembrane serine protease [Roseburia sp.]|nr:rhomboid family intramembrane serine protease [Roseburia sp.]MCM1279304.1 rhomboid family intramembrane serine protease [Robinsoniella sp.]